MTAFAYTCNKLTWVKDRKNKRLRIDLFRLHYILKVIMITDILSTCYTALSSTGASLPIALFTAGLVGGITHCAGMCGPFVLSQSNDLKKPLHTARLFYHFGRITTYICLAILFSHIFNLAALFSPSKALITVPLLLTAALIFFVNAIPALQRIFPWVLNIKMFALPLPLQNGFQYAHNLPYALREYAMGIILGFMPCGLVVAAIMAASTAPSLAQTILAMAAFGFGTMPALLSLSFGTASLQSRYPNLIQPMSSGLKIWSGLWLCITAGIILFNLNS